jgi:hypothetical protein
MDLRVRKPNISLSLLFGGLPALKNVTGSQASYIQKPLITVDFSELPG